MIGLSRAGSGGVNGYRKGACPVVIKAARKDFASRAALAGMAPIPQGSHLNEAQSMKWPFSPPETKTESAAVINQGSFFSGEISINGSLRVEGKLSGEIRGDSLVLERGSHAEGFVRVTLMTVAGFFKGEAEVTGKLTILAPARFEGRIRCACLVVEEGAQVNGQVSFLDGRPESPDAGVPAL